MNWRSKDSKSGAWLYLPTSGMALVFSKFRVISRGSHLLVRFCKPDGLVRIGTKDVEDVISPTPRVFLMGPCRVRPAVICNFLSFR